MSPFARVVPSLILLVVCGCGDATNKRMPLTGRVTYQGQPVAYGLLFLESKAGKGIQGTGIIENGVYRTAPDFGPVPGPQLVRIQVYDGMPQETSPHGALVGPDFVLDRSIEVGQKTLDFDLR